MFEKNEILELKIESIGSKGSKGRKELWLRKI